MLWPAMMPIIRRVPVPALPKSRSPAGCMSPPTPRPSTFHVSPSFETVQPSAAIALAVLSTSLRLQQPADARLPRGETAQHQGAVRIDLSPGTRNRPERARAGLDINGLGSACDKGGAPRAR